MASPQPPNTPLPAIRRPSILQGLASVSATSERNAQQDNKDGNKIIGNYDVVNDANKNHIGFDGDKFSIPKDLGTTTTLDKIYLNRFNYSDDKNVNMSLTKINEDPAKEYLFSIKLDDDSVIDESINNFLKSVGDNVDIYLFGITTGNKIDFKNLYEFKKGTTLPDALSLKYILFIGNNIINTIEWNKESSGGVAENNITPTSFKYDKIILIHSSYTDFSAKGIDGITKIDKIKKDILSKEALFCIYSIDFITFTAEMFDNLINNYYEMQGGGNKVVKKKRKNKFPKK